MNSAFVFLRDRAEMMCDDQSRRSIDRSSRLRKEEDDDGKQKEDENEKKILSLEIIKTHTK